MKLSSVTLRVCSASGFQVLVLEVFFWT